MTVRWANSGGISSTRMLFTTDMGGIFPLFKYAMHLVHNHTVTFNVRQRGEGTGRGHSIQVGKQGLRPRQVYAGSSSGVRDAIAAIADVARMVANFLSELLEIPGQCSLSYLVLRRWRNCTRLGSSCLAHLLPIRLETPLLLLLCLLLQSLLSTLA